MRKDVKNQLLAFHYNRFDWLTPEGEKRSD